MEGPREPRERLLGDHTRYMSLDDLMTNHVGQLGPMQVFLFCLVSATWLPGALVTLNLEFVGKDPISEHLWKCTSAADQACQSAFALADPTEAFCALKSSQWEWTDPRASIKSTMGLYCDQAWVADLANSVFFLGFLVGAAVWGGLSDSLGRRPMLIATCLASFVSTSVTAAAWNVPSYLIFRFVNGAAVAGIGLVAFTLACELVGPKWRGVMGIASQYFWCTGECILSLLAYLVPHWRLLMLICGSTCLFILAPVPWIPESPRWLLSKGRAKESEAVMKFIALGNKRTMPSVQLEQPAAAATGSVWDTFRVRELRKRQIIMLLSWCVVSLAFYGVSLALDALGGNLYVNFFLVSLVEFPSYAVAIMLVDRIGRKPLTIGFFSICGLSCLLCVIIPQGPGLFNALRIAAAVGGKFGGAGAFILLFIYTTELFPTVVRNAALGMDSASARAGGVLAPLVVLVANLVHAPTLSFLVFGVTSFVACLTCTLLPETNGKPLLDTLEEVEKACGTNGAAEVDGERHLVGDEEDDVELEAS